MLWSLDPANVDLFFVFSKQAADENYDLMLQIHTRIDPSTSFVPTKYGFIESKYASVSRDEILAKLKLKANENCVKNAKANVSKFFLIFF